MRNISQWIVGHIGETGGKQEQLWRKTLTPLMNELLLILRKEGTETIVKLSMIFHCWHLIENFFFWICSTWAVSQATISRRCSWTPRWTTRRPSPRRRLQLKRLPTVQQRRRHQVRNRSNISNCMKTKPGEPPDETPHNLANTSWEWYYYQSSLKNRF